MWSYKRYLHIFEIKNHVGRFFELPYEIKGLVMFIVMCLIFRIFGFLFCANIIRTQ